MNMETSSNQAMHEPADCDEHGIPTQSAHDNILNQLWWNRVTVNH